MHLYLVRHARSVGSVSHLGDDGRYLSREGRREARRAGEVLAQRLVAPDMVLTSPLVRAVQTAELLASAMSYRGEVRSSLALAPGVEPPLLLTEISGGHVIAVGHMPDMRIRTAFLLGSPLPEVPSFSTSMVICLSSALPAPGSFEFEWAYLPERDEVVDLLLDARSPD